MIAHCTCKCDRRGGTESANFQDRTYGKGMRVFIHGLIAGKAYRCTICGQLKAESSSPGGSPSSTPTKGKKTKKG